MGSFWETLRNLGPGRLAVLIGVGVALLVFFVFVTSQLSRPSFTTLYADLSPMDSAAVSGKLEELKIPFEVSPDNSKIMVARNEQGRARMLLAQDGLPNGGSMGYELFDQQNSFGTTTFVQNINQLRALQGELQRTISTLEPVQFAKVHIVLPQRELFAREERTASASVTLKLKSGKRLSTEQIYGIQNLVANSVPDLKPDHVTILDTDANMLAKGGADAAAMGGLKADEMRRNYEERLGASIEDMVGRVVGYNKVRAHVTADLNFDRTTTNQEAFDPNGTVVRSTQTVEDKNNEAGAGADTGSVSVQNNIPGGNASSGGDASGANSQSARTEETTNYEVSKTIRNTVSESGSINKLSVAVLVDGNYKTDDKGNKTYQPRSDKEIEQITALVKSAIGFDEKRGDVVDVQNMPFADIEVQLEDGRNLLFGFERSQILESAEMGMLGIMGILVLLLVIRPVVSQLIATQRAALDEARNNEMLLGNSGGPAGLLGSMGTTPQMDMPPPLPTQQEEALIDMQSIEGKVKASTAKKVGDIVTTHPNETVSILRNWMSQE